MPASRAGDGGGAFLLIFGSFVLMMVGDCFHSTEFGKRSLDWIFWFALAVYPTVIVGAGLNCLGETCLVLLHRNRTLTYYSPSKRKWMWRVRGINDEDLHNALAFNRTRILRHLNRV